MGLFDFFSKEKKETLDKGLSKTKEGVFSKLARIVAGHTTRLVFRAFKNYLNPITFCFLCHILI
jgi:hypothetical protein